MESSLGLEAEKSYRAFAVSTCGAGGWDAAGAGGGGGGGAREEPVDSVRLCAERAAATALAMGEWARWSAFSLFGARGLRGMVCGCCCG